MTMNITAVDITGEDLRTIWDMVHRFGWVAIVGAIIGVALGWALASYTSDKGWGDPSSFIYWPICAVGGIFLFASALTL